MKKLLFLLVITLLLMSCESKSGKLDREPDIRVVVVDSKPHDPPTLIQHKVKVLVNGTVGYVYSYNLFEKGDTILTKKSLVKY